MNPEISWRYERENVDHLLARLASDQDFRHLVSSDPVTALVDYSDARFERHAAPAKCGPLKTSCPPGKTCAKGSNSCKKTLITVI
jgi:putative modified peptide